MAESCLIKTLGKLQIKEYLSRYPHSVLPCHNLKTNPGIDPSKDVVDQVFDLFESFSYTTSYPYPLFNPTEITTKEVNGFDPCLKLVKEKKNWETKKDVLLRACKRETNLFTEIVSLEDAEVELPIRVANFVEHLKKNPDPHFSGSYNWYYTGGNLTTVDLCDKKYLIRPCNRVNSVLLATDIKSKKEELLVGETSRLKIKQHQKKCGPILQIASRKRNFVLRRRTGCCFNRARIREDRELEISGGTWIETEDPLVGTDLSPSAKSFVTFSMASLLSLYDVETNKAVYQREIADTGGNGWGNVQYKLDDNILLIAARASVGLFDLRSKGTERIRKWAIKGVTDLCEEVVSTAILSSGDILCATSHQLLQVDPRTSGFTRRWTHCIPTSPTLLVTSKPPQKGFERIVLCSEMSDCTTYAETSTVEIHCLPSLGEALHQARTSGTLLSHQLTARYRSSITGLWLIESSDGDTCHVLRRTSLGDIFAQTVEQSAILDSQVREHSFECFSSWEKARLPPTPQPATRKVDFAPLVSVFDEEEPEEGEEEEEEESVEFQGCRWDLRRYKDHLVGRLLERWTEHLPEEKEVEEKEVEGKEEPVLEEDVEDFEFMDKVDRWIASCANQMKENLVYSEGKLELTEEGVCEDTREVWSLKSGNSQLSRFEAASPPPNLTPKKARPSPPPNLSPKKARPLPPLNESLGNTPTPKKRTFIKRSFVSGF